MRLLVATPLFALSLLAVLRVPHGVLWKPAVGATEWGHVLALIALVVALPWGWDRAGQAATLLALFAAVLFATPTIRSFGVDPGPALATAFGGSASVERVRVGALFRAAAPPADVRTEVLAGSRKVDLYGTGTASPRPLVVALHGGSWNSGDRTQLPQIYAWLVAQGWAVAAIEYRLAPADPFPAALDDVRAALHWLRANRERLAIDPDQVVLYGRSAGAHLALLTAYADGGVAGVRGVVALYPPTDLVWSWEHPTQKRILDTPKTLSEFVGGTLSERHDAYVAASPLLQVGPGAPPTLLVHGVRDELVWHEQSERLVAVLETHRVPHVLLSLPWATHGCEANLSGPSGQLLRATLAPFLGAVRGTPSP